MKLLVVGDSFGLPRCFKNSNQIEVQYENTYPEQLRQMLKNEFRQDDILMINMSKRFNNSLFILQRDLEEVYLMQPEYLILQVGIVDCWSREKGAYICQEFKGKDPWINEDEYIKYIKDFVQKCFKSISSLKSIIIVNITKAAKEQYDRYPGSYERTITYNKKLEFLKNMENVFIADVYEEFDKELDKALCSDKVHPSPYGNFLMAQKIFKMLVNQIYFDKAIERLKENDKNQAIGYFTKVYDSGLIEEDLYWKAMNQLITLYLDNKKHKKLMNILFSENINQETYEKKDNFKELIHYVAEKFIENIDIEFKNIREKYFVLLDYLIKLDKLDLFNSMISKFIKQYDCFSYEKHGVLMLKYGLDELATEAFIKAVDLNSNNAKVYSYIAKKFVEIKEFNDALDFAFRALEIDEKDMDAYDVVIYVYEIIEKLDKANKFRLLKKQYIDLKNER